MILKFKQTFSAFFLLLGSMQLNAQVAQIPFEFNREHIYVKVRTGKSDDLYFIFDTGATGGASIDSLKAERAGLSKENRRNVAIAGSGGIGQYPVVYNQSLYIGNLEMKNIDMSLVNFDALNAGTGAHVDGIVGYPILNKYVTKLDLDQNMLFLYRSIAEVDTTGYTGIQFEFSKNILIPRFPVSVTLANAEVFTGKVMFDTGNVFSLIVSAPFSNFHAFKSKLGKTFRIGGRGLAAETNDEVAVIKSMSFNGFNFGKMSVRLTINEKAEPKDGYLGILGMEIIRRFNVILDYGHKKIYLKPNHAYRDSLKIEVPPAESALTEKQRLIIEENKAFLERNKREKDVKVTASGLQYKILKEGSGEIPNAADRVTLYYKLTLIDGTKLWSDFDSMRPWEHHLDKTIAGIKEAVLMMHVGSKWRLFIPPSLAFGDFGFELVPPGAAVICDVELIGKGI